MTAGRARGAGTARRRSTRTHLIVLAGFVVMAALLFLPALVHPTATLIGATTADNSQHAWFLRWLPYAIAHGHNPFITTSVIGHQGVNLMWNTWIPLPALLLSPVTLLAGPLAAFDVAIVLGTALSGWCAYLAASRWVTRTGAAVAAGAAYALAPFILDQAYAGHSNMVIAVLPPLLAIALDVILLRQSVSARRAGLLLGALLAAQLYITEELLASAAVVALIAIVVAATIARTQLRDGARHALRALGWALLVLVPLTAYPLWFQFFGPQVPRRVLPDANFFVTDLLNIVLPTTAQGFEPSFAAAAAQHYSGSSAEWGGYIGLPMLAIALYTTARWWRVPLVRIASLTGAGALLLSLGSTLHVRGVDTHVPLPGAVLAHLPLVDDLLASRLSVYVALCAALLLAVFLDRVAIDPRGRRVALVAMVLVVATYLPPLPFPTRAPATPAYFTDGAAQATEGSVVLVVPFSHDFYSTAAMLWQAQAGLAFAMPEGYIINRQPSGLAGQGPPPSATGRLLIAVANGSAPAAVSAADRESILTELRRWRVTTVVLGPMERSGAMRAVLTALLGGPPIDHDGVAVWRSVPAP